MVVIFKCFCGCKILRHGVQVMGQIMPLISIGLLVYTFTLKNSLEIWLCLIYAVINLGVNLFLIMGCKNDLPQFFLPWLSWVLLCIILSTSFAPVLIHAGLHIKTLKDDRSMKFIVYGGILLLKSCIDFFLWAGVFSLYNEIRLSQIVLESSQDETGCPDDLDQEAPEILNISETSSDEPPSYDVALQLQETKQLFPPSYQSIASRKESSIDSALKLYKSR